MSALDLDLSIGKPLKTGRRRVQDAVLATLQPKSVEATYRWVEYINRETGHRYDYHHYKPNEPQRLPCDGTDEGCQNPNHMAEKAVVYSDRPTYALFKGGEGGGKSVAGIIKALERLRRGMSGAMVSPDFEHFKKSLWAEFRRWCPLEAVLERERYRLRVDWEPSKQFELHIYNQYGGLTTLYLGGMDDPMGWEGPNLSWAHGDEVRRKDNADILKVLAGRVRIPGPKGEPPQLWFTTTPKMHWLYDYFGGVPDPFGNLDEGQEHWSVNEHEKKEPRDAFKKKAVVVSLYTVDNQSFLTSDYVEDRGAALSNEAEKRVTLWAAWEDVADVSHFLRDISLWDACRDRKVKPLGPHDPVMMALDGAYSGKGDTFAEVIAGPHPDPDRENTVSIRLTRQWKAEGVPQDFENIEDQVKMDCLDYAVQEVFYDPKELHYMMQRLRHPSYTKDGREFPGVRCTEFPQGAPREQADKAFHDRVITRRVTHDGEPNLRKHIQNADKKTDANGKRMRIVKRQETLKIDLAVAASMVCFHAHRARMPVEPPGSRRMGPFR